MEFNDRRSLGYIVPRDKNGETLYRDPAKFDAGTHVFSREELDKALSMKTAHRLDDDGEWRRARVSEHVHVHGGKDFMTYPPGGTIHDGRKAL